MTVGELRELLTQYPDAMPVATEDRDGWLIDRLDVETRVIERAADCAFSFKPGDEVVVIC